MNTRILSEDEGRKLAKSLDKGCRIVDRFISESQARERVREMHTAFPVRLANDSFAIAMLVHEIDLEELELTDAAEQALASALPVQPAETAP